MPTTPLSYLPDLFYRPQQVGGQLGYSNYLGVPDTAVPPPVVPGPSTTPPPVAQTQIPNITPNAPGGFQLREAMSPQALGEDPVLAISEIVRRMRQNDFVRTLLMSVLQVRPPNMQGRGGR